MSKEDIKSRIEMILSDILSAKYDAKITIKFVELKEKNVNGNRNTSRNIGEE